MKLLIVLLLFGYSNIAWCVASQQEEEKVTSKVRRYEGGSLTTIASRLNRLEQLAEQRQDLVEEYETQIQGDRTIFDLIGKHVMKAIQSRHIFPVSDRECYWNYLRERCEPLCLCNFQYKFGDFHPGRSCRLVKNLTTKSAALASVVSPHTEHLPYSWRGQEDCDFTNKIGPIRSLVLRMITHAKRFWFHGEE
jgi:hypothetical protein